MTHIILSWCGAEDAAVVTDEDGNNMMFESGEDADTYAQNNCAWYWKVIYMGAE